jgi:hypothetical protein
MKKKMKRYEDGGEVEFESKVGPKSSIDEMTRIRAQDYAEEMQRPAPEIETKEAPKAKAKAVAKKKDVVYSPKSLPESDREENSAFMRQFRKDEAAAKAKAEPSFLKGTKGFKNIGEAFKAMRRSAGITSYKSGGSVSSASKRADGCAVKGKTRGKMV